MLKFLVLITTVLALAIGVAAQPAAAQEPIDVSGEWTVEISGSLSTFCDLRFEQSGETLDANGTCSGFGPATFSGTIDPSGEFVLSGPVSITTVDIEGSYSHADETLNGSWNAFGLRGTFVGTRGATAPPSGIDLSGQWMVEITGQDAVSGCNAVFDQSGSKLEVTVDCGTAGIGELHGSVTAQSVSLRGTIAGQSGAVNGAFAPDGNAVSGGWQGSSVGPAAFLAVRSELRSTPIDLTGTWDVRLSAAGLGIACETILQQASSALFAALTCDLAGTGTLEGGIDPNTGVFRIAGALFGNATVLGVASQDGQSATGAWGLTGFLDLAGTLDAERGSHAIVFPDVSGPWVFYLGGETNDHCTVDLEQGSAEFGDVSVWLAGSVECRILTDTAVTGSVRLLNERVVLFGQPNSSAFGIEGTAANPDLIEGDWYGIDLREFGCFVATRPGAPQPESCVLPRNHPRMLGNGFGGSLFFEPQIALLGPVTDAGRNRTIGGLAGLAAGMTGFGLLWAGLRRWG